MSHVIFLYRLFTLNLQFNPFPNDKFYADPNWKTLQTPTSNLMNIIRKFSTVGKGEIARYEQFFLLPLCFQKTCTAET